jgi:endonuclease/exonuclease/phosphatase family metal-dependent hydrolase
MRIAFWNINKKSFVRDIVEFISKKDIDILILAECTVSVSRIQEELDKAFSQNKYKGLKKVKHHKFKIFTRLNVNHIRNFDSSFGGPSWSINKITFSNLVNLSIVCVHFPSKMHWDDLSQSLEAVNLMNKIRSYETKNGKNTLLIGDFNMNPYEPGMISSMGLHGMKDANIAKKKNRVVQGKSYDFFYNPMWNFLGDGGEVPGTFFYPKAVHHNVMWNTFDQILIRPNLLNFMKISDIEIIRNIGTNQLIDSRTKQIKETYSDHLPLLLTLNL